MIRCAIYILATGMIQQISHCVSIDNATAACCDGQAVMEVAETVSDDTHYIGSGLVVDIPTQPSPAFRWDWATHLWVDPRTFKDLQDAKWESIKASRERVFDAPLVTPYGTFDNYVEARNNITNAAMLSRTATDMGAPIDIAFTLLNNNTVLLDLVAISRVGLMMGAKLQDARKVATDIRTCIGDATSQEQLDAIAWPT